MKPAPATLAGSGTLPCTEEEWRELISYTEALRALNDRLRSTCEQLSSLLTLGQAMEAAGSRERVGEILLEIMPRVLPYRGAVILLYDSESGFQRQHATGLNAEMEAALDGHIAQGALEWVRDDPQPLTLEAQGSSERVASYTLLPLLFQEEFVGVLWMALELRVEEIGLDLLQVACSLASHAAAAFRNAAYADLERSYQKLHALESIKDDLVHMVIHDLRSPLAVIMGNIDTALSCATSEKQSGILERAVAGCEGMLTLIGNLLDISRMEEGKLHLHRGRFSLAEIVQPGVDSLASIATRARKAIHCDLPPDLPLVDGDRDLLRRVVANLLGNALKYSPPDETIVVAARRTTADGEIVVSVTDHGPGVSPEYHEKIFEKFGQVEAKHSHERIGSGLGLTFCRMVVQAHGGRIWLESSPGEYARFLFSLPDAA